MPKVSYSRSDLVQGGGPTLDEEGKETQSNDRSSMKHFESLFTVPKLHIYS